jgi:energy-converting hydrogenase Eha subunit F
MVGIQSRLVPGKRRYGKGGVDKQLQERLRAQFEEFEKKLSKIAAEAAPTAKPVTPPHQSRPVWSKRC